MLKEDRYRWIKKYNLVSGSKSAKIRHISYFMKRSISHKKCFYKNEMDNNVYFGIQMREHTEYHLEMAMWS